MDENSSWAYPYGLTLYSRNLLYCKLATPYPFGSRRSLIGVSAERSALAMALQKRLRRKPMATSAEFAARPSWVKRRRTQFEQMSSAVDPTADMPPLANTGSSRKRESSRGRDISHTLTLTGETRSGSSRYATRLGNAGPCTALTCLHSSKLQSFPNGWKGTRCI